MSSRWNKKNGMNKNGMNKNGMNKNGMNKNGMNKNGGIFFFDNYKFIYMFNINAKMRFRMQGIPA